MKSQMKELNVIKEYASLLEPLFTEDERNKLYD